MATNVPPNATGWATINQVGCSAGLAAYVEALPDKGGYFGRFVPGYVAYWPTYRETRAKLLAEQEEVYDLARPRPHRYELKVL